MRFFLNSCFFWPLFSLLSNPEPISILVANGGPPQSRLIQSISAQTYTHHTHSHSHTRGTRHDPHTPRTYPLPSVPVRGNGSTRMPRDWLTGQFIELFVNVFRVPDGRRVYVSNYWKFMHVLFDNLLLVFGRAANGTGTFDAIGRGDLHVLEDTYAADRSAKKNCRRIGTWIGFN